MIIPDRNKWKSIQVPEEFYLILSAVAKKKKKKKKEIFKDLERYLLTEAYK